MAGCVERVGHSIAKIVFTEGSEELFTYFSSVISSRKLECTKYLTVEPCQPPPCVCERQRYTMDGVHYFEIIEYLQYTLRQFLVFFFAASTDTSSMSSKRDFNQPPQFTSPTTTTTPKTSSSVIFYRLPSPFLLIEGGWLSHGTNYEHGRKAKVDWGSEKN